MRPSGKCCSREACFRGGRVQVELEVLILWFCPDVCGRVGACYKHVYCAAFYLWRFQVSSEDFGFVISC